MEEIREKVSNRLFWYVKIDEKERKDKRIFVEYLPIEDRIVFRGQLQDTNTVWNDMCVSSYNLYEERVVNDYVGTVTMPKIMKKQYVLDEIDFDNCLLTVYDEMISKIENLRKISEKINEYKNTVDGISRLSIRIGFDGSEEF